MYNPVIQKIDSKDHSYSLNKLNNISTGVLSYTPRLGKVVSSFVGMYSYYQLSDMAKMRMFQNINFNNTTVFNARWRSNIGATWLVSNTTDSLNSSTTMMNAELTYSGARGASITLGGKYTYNLIIGNQLGGLARISIPLIKGVNAEIEAQRLVMGDFYNSMYQAEVKRFPYYGFVKILMNW